MQENHFTVQKTYYYYARVKKIKGCCLIFKKKYLCFKSLIFKNCKRQEFETLFRSWFIDIPEVNVFLQRCYNMNDSGLLPLVSFKAENLSWIFSPFTGVNLIFAGHIWKEPHQINMLTHTYATMWYSLLWKHNQYAHKKNQKDLLALSDPLAPDWPCSHRATDLCL